MILIFETKNATNFKDYWTRNKSTIFKGTALLYGGMN